MNFRPIIYVAAGGVLGFFTIAAILLFIPGSYQFKGTEFDPSVPAADFSLEDASGQTFRMSEQVGNVVLLFFGYTHCPDVCPVTLNDFRHVEEALGADADDVTMVMITVDPDRDTSEVVHEYVSRFSPEIVGLSGPEKVLNEVWKGYFVYRAIQTPETGGEAHADEAGQPHEGYLVDHTARVYVVDKSGNLRLSFPFAVGAEAITADVRQLLRE